MSFARFSHNGSLFHHTDVRGSQITEQLVELQREIYNRTHGGKRPARYLLPRLTDPRNLLAAWHRVSHSRGAKTAGPDGQTCAKIAPRVAEFLDQLAEELTQLRYRPGKIRRIEVPKKPGHSGTRTLSLLNVRDRVVHAAIKQVLEPVLEPRFDRRSYGFRPGRSVARAAQAVCARLARADQVSTEFTHVANVDIADCFDSLDIDILLQQLGKYVEDSRFLTMLERILRSGAEKRGWLRVRDVGVPQGSALSPLLCNLYLHSIDEALAEVAYTTGGIEFFRYADDLVIFAAGRIAMLRALRVLRRQLKALRLRTRNAPHIGRIRDGFEWLGLRFVSRKRPWFSGLRFACEIPADKVVEMFQRVDEMTVPPSTHLNGDVVDLGRWIVSLNTQLKQWASVYRITLNSREVFMDLDDHVYQRVGQLIRSVTGLSMSQVREQYAVDLPRGFRTWEVNGCRLAVLAAVKPTRRESTVVRPAWAGQTSKRALPMTTAAATITEPLPATMPGTSEPDADFLLWRDAPLTGGESHAERPASCIPETEEAPFDTELPPGRVTAGDNGSAHCDVTTTDDGNNGRSAN